MIYHLHIGVIGGRSGSGRSQSAVGFAAYCAGEKITADYTGITYDYRKKEHIEISQIFLPDHAPDRFADRGCLWNEVEKLEKPKDGRLCRIVDAALPNELPLDAAKEIFSKFGKYFSDQGIICDAALHAVPGNIHLHCLLTTRPVDQEGFCKVKSKSVYKLDEEGNKIPLLDSEGNQKTDKKGYPLWQRTRINQKPWDSKEWLLNVRKEWEILCNEKLERNNIEGRIDCRSYEEQGIEQLPTRHEGKAAIEMEKRGITCDVCSENRQIRKINSVTDMIERISARVEVLKDKVEIGFMRLLESATDRVEDILERSQNIYGNVDLYEADKISDREDVELEEDPIDKDDWWDPV